MKYIIKCYLPVVVEITEDFVKPVIIAIANEL